MMTTSASSSSSCRSLRSAAVPERVPQRRRELVDLAQPVGDDAGRRDDERLERLALALDLRVLVLDGEQERDGLHRLAETHVVGEDAARADVVEEPEPRKPCSWYGRSVALRLRGFLVPLISSMSCSFWKSSFVSSRDARSADLGEELLDAPGLREREAARRCRRRSPGSPPGAAGLRGPSADRAARTSRRRGARTCALGEAARELVLRDGDALALEGEAQVTASRRRSRRARSPRAPRRGPGRRRGRPGRRDPTRPAARAMPSVQKRIASSPRATKLVAVLVRDRGRERAACAAAVLLRGDVAADALRALAAPGRAAVGAPSRPVGPPAGGGLTITGGVMPSARTSISTSS